MADIQMFYGLKQEGVFTDDFFIIREKCALEKFEYFMVEINDAISIRKEKITEISEEDYRTIFNFFTFFKADGKYRNGWVSYNNKYFFAYLNKE